MHKVLYQLAVIEGGKYFASCGHASKIHVYILLQALVQIDYVHIFQTPHVWQSNNTKVTL